MGRETSTDPHDTRRPLAARQLRHLPRPPMHFARPHPCSCKTPAPPCPALPTPSLLASRALALPLLFLTASLRCSLPPCFALHPTPSADLLPSAADDDTWAEGLQDGRKCRGTDGSMVAAWLHDGRKCRTCLLSVVVVSVPLLTLVQASLGWCTPFLGCLRGLVCLYHHQLEICSQYRKTFELSIAPVRPHAQCTCIGTLMPRSTRSDCMHGTRSSLAACTGPCTGHEIGRASCRERV